MGVLIIIIVLVFLWAYKSGRPMKLVLAPEEAKQVRERWWRFAKTELKVWALFFVLGYALVGNALAAEHWKWYVYVFIVWCSLMLCSRLAIWVTVAGVAICFIVGTVAEAFGHKLPAQFVAPVIIAVPMAIIIRALLFCFTPVAGASVKSSEPPAPIKFVNHDHEEPVYDWETDTYLYKEGNREPAFLRYPRYKDRPENRRNRLFDRDDEL